MHESTNYLAFGYVINKAVIPPGNISKTKTKKYVAGDWYMVDGEYNPNLSKQDYENGNFTYNEIALIVSGKIAVTPMHTMSPVYYTRGYCNIDSLVAKGIVKEEVIETSIVFGIVPFDNLDKDPILPDISVLRWEVGSIIQPPAKFFLADGSFKRDGVTHSTIGAYNLTSGNIEVTTHCLGFIFNS